jgi:Histidine phosphatase superfamily (branch 1)
MPEKKTISVYLLRHGEREDEIEDESKAVQQSNKELLDPALTVEGFRQAQAAFENLLSTLAGKKVSIFSSPLRRTIGTALMVAFAPSANNVNFSLPSLAGDTSTPDSLPILVMNGLCDCAAMIERVGGANLAVAQGYVDDAAMDENDGSDSSPFVCSLPKIVSEAQRSSSCTRPSMIQFWKEKTYVSASFSPLTPPLRMQKILQPSNASLSSQETRKPVSSRKSDDCYLATLNRAIRLAVNADCDACVVVTHREGIRDLAGKAAGHGKSAHKLQTPYCCVATFVATACSEEVQWHFKGVSPYEKIIS